MTVDPVEPEEDGFWLEIRSDFMVVEGERFVWERVAGGLVLREIDFGRLLF